MLKKKRIPSRTLFVLISFAILIAYILLSEDLQSLARSFNELNLYYIILGFLFVIGYISCDALSIWTLRRQFQKGVSFWSCQKASFISIGLGSITPFTSGYLAGQITIMAKTGMSASEGGTVVLQKTIRYIIISLLVNLLLIYFNLEIFDITKAVKILVIASIIATVVYLIFLSLVTKAEKTLTRIFIKAANLGHKLHLIKHIDKTNKKIQEQTHLLNYRMTNHKVSLWTNIKTYFFCFIEVLLLYSVTWSIYMAFYSINPTYSIFQVIACQSLCNVIQQVAPIPGGVGLADAAFHDVMTSLLGKNLNFGLFTWRIMTFYFPIIMSFILMGFKNKVYPSTKMKKTL